MTFEWCEKRKRILEEDGHLLVVGGPGSGKTTIALCKAAARVERGIAPGQKVLFLSFSRAAVGRILASATMPEVPSAARAALTVQTFHSFFWEVLRSHGYLLGLPRKLALLLPHDELALRQGETEETSEAWLREREELIVRDGRAAFVTFAPKVLELLKRSRPLREQQCSRYPLIIVDEAQDTDDTQWACVQELAKGAQVMCLADLDQQIYDFRPGVTRERIKEVEQHLNPLRIDFEAQNHRSSATEITAFGNDVLSATPRGAKYRGVLRLRLPPKAGPRDAHIVKALGILAKRVKAATGQPAKSLAILTRRNRGVAICSSALLRARDGRGIPHRVLLDDSEILLAARVVALALEPCGDDIVGTERQQRACLAAIVDVHRAKGTAGGRQAAARIGGAFIPLEQRRRRQVLKVESTLAGALLEGKDAHTGKPADDWAKMIARLRESGCADLVHVAELAQELATYNRMHRIIAGLVETWRAYQSYFNARTILDLAIAEEQLLADMTEPKGISIMTMHKAKGKEFDGVLIVDTAANSPITDPHEEAPFSKSRTLLRVAVTRARHHVVLLTDASKPPPILEGHQL